MSKQIILVEPRGFCAGVARAIKILDLALERTDGQVYVRHQIIHNRRVVRDYEEKGVRFVESLNEVPEGSIVVLSAHGTSPEVFKKAKKKKLIVVDGVCPLVTKVHLEAKRLVGAGYFVIYVGHRGHQEGIGVLGEIPKGKGLLIENIKEARECRLPDGAEKVGVLTQTTLNYDEVLEVIEELQGRFPDLKLPPGGDICYATKGRQGAVIKLAKEVGVVIVVGSEESSNSKQLRERAEEQGVKSYLVDDVNQIKREWFEGKDKIGVTAGASGPDYLVEEIIEKIKEITKGEVKDLIVEEDKVEFSNLPKELELI